MKSHPKHQRQSSDLRCRQRGTQVDLRLAAILWRGADWRAVGDEAQLHTSGTAPE